MDQIGPSNASLQIEVLSVIWQHLEPKYTLLSLSITNSLYFFSQDLTLRTRGLGIDCFDFGVQY